MLDPQFLPILLVGAGRMGGALVAGWRLAGVIRPADLIIRDPHPGPEALAAVLAGASLDPPDHTIQTARTVILAVKPQAWRTMAAEIAPLLAPDACVISILAGVGAEDLKSAFGARDIARVMPTTAAAISKGTASIWSASMAGRARARHLFEPLGSVVALERESLMHVATAASGSAPAYLYAFLEALEAAAVANGLDPKTAATMTRSTLTGAAALLEQSSEDPGELRRQVTSPGGTTQAALEILMGPQGLQPLLQSAVAAAVGQSQALGG